jgi:hypothetical protein
VRAPNGAVVYRISRDLDVVSAPAAAKRLEILVKGALFRNTRCQTPCGEDAPGPHRPGLRVGCP